MREIYSESGGNVQGEWVEEPQQRVMENPVGGLKMKEHRVAEREVKEEDEEKAAKRDT